MESTNYNSNTEIKIEDIKKEDLSDECKTSSSDNELKLVCIPDIDVINIDSDNELDYSEEKDSNSTPTKCVFEMAPKLAGLTRLPATKRKHNVLSLETKIELLQKLEEGESFNSLAIRYNIGRATIFDIKNRKESILAFASKLKNEEELRTRKTVRKSKSKSSQSVNAIKPLYNDGFVSSRRRHNVLSIERKIEIIQRLESGESGASLAPLYNVGRATISDIKNKKDSILMFASKLNSEEGLKRRKTMRRGNDRSLEDAVYKWYTQKISQGETVSGPALCRKALEINTKLGGHVDFKASTGWLKNFKARHGLRHLRIEHDTFKGDISAANMFLQSYFDLLQQDGYSKDDIYSADETIVNWQSLPKMSLAYQRLKQSNNLDRVTVMASANMSWNHALPLLMIGRTKKEKCFKGISCLPVIYMSEKNGWMDAELFIDWYSNYFIPAVKRERELSGKCGNVMLLLDNAAYHPAVDMLNKVNDKFKVTFLPRNLTSLRHPMDQGTIKKLKRMFRKQILRRLLLANNNEESVIEYANKLTLKECCYMLADAWNTLSQVNMKTAWKIFWSEPEKPAESHDPLSDDKEYKEFVELFKVLPGFSRCIVDDAIEWFSSDDHDPGHEILNEDEIITSVKTEDLEEYDDYETDAAGKEDTRIKPTHAEAFSAFEIIMAWCEQQKECFPEQLLLIKGLKDLAAKKSLNVWNASISEK